MSTCRDCQAEVIFVPSAKTGKPMILDAEPKKGVVLRSNWPGHPTPWSYAEEDDHGAIDQAHVVDVFTDHHVTCPAAAAWKGQTRATRKGND